MRDKVTDIHVYVFIDGEIKKLGEGGWFQKLISIVQYRNNNELQNSVNLYPHLQL